MTRADAAAAARASSQGTAWPAWPWLALLIAFGVLWRVALLADYPPQLVPDTGTYLQAARDLISGDFTLGQGRRTPGYPLLIVLVGESPRALVLAQMTLGLAISALLFWIALRLTRRPAIAFAAGLSYHLNLQQLFQETALMTETLATLGVAATLGLWMLVAHRLRNGRDARASSLLLGALAAFAILVRPQFIFFVALLPLLLLLDAPGGLRRPGRRALVAAALVFAAASAPILGWCGVMAAKVGTFTLSSQSGFGMVNHAIDFIEFAPERYAPARDVLLQTRERRIAEAGHSRNTIWYAWPEIRRVTGWTLPQASRELQSMCMQMFAAHPLRYAFSVATAWRDFWTVPIPWDPALIAPPALGTALQAVWWVEHKALRLANLAFVLTVLAVVAWPRARRALGWDFALTAIAATVLLSSLVQALFDQGASSRYAIPTQALVVLVLLVAWHRARTRRLSMPAGAAAARARA